MSKKNLIKEAIADANDIKSLAIANAKAALDEALTPQIKSMLAKKLAEEMGVDNDQEEGIDENEASESIDLDSAIKEVEGSEDEDEKDIDEKAKPKKEDEPEEESEEDLDEAEGEDSILSKIKELIKKAGPKAKDIAKKLTDKEYLQSLSNSLHTSADNRFKEEAESDEPEEEEEEDIDIDEILNSVSEADEPEEEESEEDLDEETGDEKSDGSDNKDDSVLQKIKDILKNAGAKGKEALKKLGDKEYLQSLSNSLHAAGDRRFKEETEEGSLEELRTQIQEIKLFNAQLLYLNKFLSSHELTESQKTKAIEAFDNTETAREAKLVFESLNTLFKNKSKQPVKKSLKESVAGGSSKAAGGSTKKVIKESAEQKSDNDFKSRMQKLAGII